MQDVNFEQNEQQECIGDGNCELCEIEGCEHNPNLEDNYNEPIDRMCDYYFQDNINSNDFDY